MDGTHKVELIPGGVAKKDSNTQLCPSNKLDRRSSVIFTIGLIISQAAGITAISLVLGWTVKYLGGFAWSSDASKQLNFHPLFMVIGLIFLYGEAILVYRAMRVYNKPLLKRLHAAINIVAFIFTVVALKAVFDFHDIEYGGSHLYTIHSWIGITAVGLFAAQFLCGFVTFLFPEFTPEWKKKYLSVHVFFGVAIFVMSIAAALMGLLEKMNWSVSNYNQLHEDALIGNCLGVMLMVFGITVVYLVSNPRFKRSPLPGEIPPTLVNINIKGGFIEDYYGATAERRPSVQFTPSQDSITVVGDAKK